MLLGRSCCSDRRELTSAVSGDVGVGMSSVSELVLVLSELVSAVSGDVGVGMS